MGRWCFGRSSEPSADAVVFFDLGWTLEDESPAQEARARRTVEFARTRGVKTSVSEILELQLEAGREGAPSVYAAALARLGMTPEDHQEARRLFPWNPELCRLFPDARRLLRLPAGSLGLIANQSRPIASRLQTYGIHHLFGVMACSCDLGLEKPDPAFYQWASDRAAALGDPGPHWMVGDRVDNDIVPARALGWHTIRIVVGDYRLYRSREAREQPDLEVATLAEAFEELRSRIPGINP